MSLTVALSHQANGLTDLREEWQALQERSSARGIYLTWEWVSTWWAHFGDDKQLWLLQARDAQGSLIGLGTLVLDLHPPQLGSVHGRSWRQLEFIGARDNCEHLGFLLEPGQESRIVQAFMRAIKRRQRSWDALHLSGIASDSALLDTLQRLDMPWHRAPSIVAPYIPLTGDWDHYFNRLSAPKRKAQRRRLRLLDKEFPDNWAFQQVTHPHELRPALDRLVHLHQAVWEDRGEAGAFGDPQRKEFLYALAERFLAAGWLRLSHVTLDGKMAAILFSYEHRGRIYDLVSGIDWDYRNYNVGHILTQLAIHNAVGNGVDEYDFLWGEEPYKYEWRAEDREHVTLICFASPIARMQHLGFKAARRVKRHAGDLLGQLTKRLPAPPVSAAE